MPETRTTEQIEADEALHTAIERCARAYWDDDHPMVTDFVVLAVRESAEKPGEREYNYLLPGGTMPWDRILGIVHTFRAMMERNMVGTYGHDTD